MNEFEYLKRRAEAETQLAQHAAHPRAVQAHYAMASAYLDRLYPCPDSLHRTTQRK